MIVPRQLNPPKMFGFHPTSLRAVYACASAHIYSITYFFPDPDVSLEAREVGFLGKTSFPETRILGCSHQTGSGVLATPEAFELVLAFRRRSCAC